MLSLKTEQTLSLINATIQDALMADTYFLGIVRDVARPLYIAKERGRNQIEPGESHRKCDYRDKKLDRYQPV